MGRWLKTVRAIYGLDQIHLAQTIGKSRSAVAMYERGTPVPAETVALIRTAYPDAPQPPQSSAGIDVAGSLAQVGELAQIRYAGVVPCSSTWGDPLSSSDVRPIDAKFTGRNRFLCLVTGDSCYPALIEGDLTIWEADKHPPDGVIVLAERSDDQACTVKELRQSNGGEPALVPINPDAEPPPNEGGWAVTARLVGVIRQHDGPERTWYWEPGLRAKHLTEK